ncbi:hypothetical protein BDV59DRAFT_176039, partial [Aspergillus ambiguus]|uniref:uncharacterized protein n=1 Tax=Aspergillus ambiguus TaxID=176160 RepID=UPI003CCE0190
MLSSTATTIGLGLLRLSPALITTTLCINRVGQYFALTSFRPPFMPRDQQHLAAPLFQTWFRSASGRIWKGVIILTQLQRLLCIANLVVRPSTTISWWLYGASFILSNAHLPFVPRLLAAENRILGEQQKAPEESLAALGDWLKANNIRVLAVDLPLLLVTTAASVASGHWQ